MEYKFVYLIQLTELLVKCITTECALQTKDTTTSAQQANVLERIFLKRQKRFLIFEQGALMTFQGHINKAIISRRPRGLNEIIEYTLTYDLPWTFELPKPNNSKKSTTPAKKVGKPTTPKPTTWWIDDKPYPTWQDDSNWQPASKEPQKLWCPKQHIFQTYYDASGKNALPWCGEYRNRHKRNKPINNNSPPKIEPQQGTLLFDLIAHLADLHGFNARHCIMRILCESRHLLLPPGRLLFHDLVRILLSHAQTAIERHAAFRAAIHRENLQECIQLYGLHCRWSFLQHFTESIATPANSMAISLAPLRRPQHIEFM